MKYLLPLLTLILSCNTVCEDFDPQACVNCDPPLVCQNGRCICDTNNYYVFADYCLERGQKTYINSDNKEQYLSRQLTLDSIYYAGGGIYDYQLEMMEDSIYYDVDKLIGTIQHFTDGDSLILQGVFSDKYIDNKLSKMYFYAKQNENELRCHVYWREQGNFLNILDSGKLTLYRDKP